MGAQEGTCPEGHMSCLEKSPLLVLKQWVLIIRKCLTLTFFFFLQVIYFQNSQCKHSTLNSEAKLSKIIINRGQSSSTSIKMDFRIVFIFFGVVKSMTRLSNWIKTKQKGHFYTVNSREFEIFYRSSYLNFQVPFSPISTLTLVQLSCLTWGFNLSGNSLSTSD